MPMVTAGPRAVEHDGLVLPCTALLQRVGFALGGIDGAYSPRIDPAPLSEGQVFHPVSMKQPRETVIPFDAARLVVNSVFLVVLPGELLLGRPGPCPYCRILDSDGIFQRIRAR